MGRAAIALGSNLAGRAGSREANLDGALLALGRLGAVEARSAWVDTAPVGYRDQPRFLNGAAVLRTDLPPEALLAALLRVEREFGRDRSHGIANGPRTLDLDLLLYDSCVLTSAALVLPHPALHLRRFVLEPLAAIAPEWEHPVLRRSVGQLLDALDSSDAIHASSSAIGT